MTALLLALALTAPARAAPPGFVALDRVAPRVLQDMRYATRYNFVGRRIDGYREPRCILTRRAALALRRAQRALAPKGYTLKVYDCYRPRRAVEHFARWAGDPADHAMKREFYPRVRKASLFDAGYLARRSGHSRGSTVDLTLVRLPARRQPRWSRARFGLVSCLARYRRRFPDNGVDMGTGYDCLDPRAHVFHPGVTGRARANRLLLRRTLDRVGFAPYDNEWWHFTLRDEPHPGRYFDFPVSRAALR